MPGRLVDVRNRGRRRRWQHAKGDTAAPVPRLPGPEEAPGPVTVTDAAGRPIARIDPLTRVRTAV